ncbi:MAG: DNA polymerase I [Fidelibacterota bacterium]
MSPSKAKRKRFFLIDGYAMLYRAHFAMIRNPLITSYGLQTSALFGFINQLFKLLREGQPDYLMAAFDSSEKTFRHKRYPEYKATREKMPDEMREQLPYLWKILEAMRIPVYEVPGWEADDIIGTLARRAQDQEFETYIVSGDKDFMQLVSDRVFLYTPSGRQAELKIYDREKVIDKWGVPPEKIVDLLGLMGDNSDNVPGVVGVGPKTAVELLKTYGSLEAALDHAEEVRNKRAREGLLSCRDLALLSRELVTIDTDMDIEVDWEAMKTEGIDVQALQSIFQELEFHTLAKQLETFQPEPQTTENRPDKQYNIINNIDELKLLLKDIQAATLLSFDLETTATDPMRAELVGISFSTEKDVGYYLPLRGPELPPNRFGPDDEDQVLQLLRPVFEDSHIPKTGQNVKYDMLLLKRKGVPVQGVVFDTMIAAHLLNPELRSYKLDRLSKEYLQYRMVPYESLSGKGKEKKTLDKVEVEKVAFYSAEDADVALQLSHILKAKLQNAQLLEFYEKVEIPLIPVLVDMQFTGLYVDGDILHTMSVEMTKRIEALSKEIIELAGTEFNINSTQQLATILFDRIGLKPIRKRSTAENVLEILQHQHPLPKLILAYRKLNKLKNTYLDALPALINPETGRIHSTFSQTIVATGRLSSSNPNFQNIPIRREEGREIRKAFRAQEKGWCIFSADYSQIELRIMAHLSQDPALRKAFLRNEDVHARTASDVFGVPIDEVLPEMRATAKVVNFGIMYGAGPFRMSQELGIPRAEAQEIIDAYFKRYQGIKFYIENTLQKAEEDHYVSTLLGRRRPVWNISSDNYVQREAAKRMAINMPIQGTAAEMIKLAMIAIHRILQKEQFRAKMVLQIHDELLFEVPEDEVEALQKMVVREMENALPLSVPLVVDCGVGQSWFEAHS